MNDTVFLLCPDLKKKKKRLTYRPSWFSSQKGKQTSFFLDLTLIVSVWITLDVSNLIAKIKHWDRDNTMCICCWKLQPTFTRSCKLEAHLIIFHLKIFKVSISEWCISVLTKQVVMDIYQYVWTYSVHYKTYFHIQVLDTKKLLLRCKAVNGSQLAKMKQSIPVCPCHKIYRDEEVGLKSCRYTWKITTSVKMWNLGQYRENLIFCQ